MTQWSSACRSARVDRREFDDGERLVGRPVVRDQEIEPAGDRGRQLTALHDALSSALAALRFFVRCSARSRASFTR